MTKKEGTATAVPVSNYEYGIRFRYVARPHREGMTEREAHDWIASLPTVGLRTDVFSIIRRPVGEWEAVTTATAEAVASDLQAVDGVEGVGRLDT